MTSSFAMRIAPAPDVMFRTVDDESVLLDLKSETYLGLDPVGTRMWTLLTRSGSIQEAYEALLREYDVDPDRLRADLEDFVQKLVANDLVQVGLSEAAAQGTR
jgi:hypothetical protein